MRWTIAAAALLPQVLPASPTEFSTGDQRNEIHDANDAIDYKNKNMNKNFDFHDSPSGRATLVGLQQQALKLPIAMAERSDMHSDGILRNSIFNQDWDHDDDDLIKECDPLSDDADIGILSCGEGRYCQANEDFKLGGICSATAVSRDLSIQGVQSSDFTCTGTTSTSQCDCSNFNSSTLSGPISCEYKPYECFGCPTYCLSAKKTATFATGKKLEAVTYCVFFKIPYHVKYCYYYMSASSPICVMSINDVNCSSCSKTYFDCTNIPKGMKGNSNTSSPLRILEAMNTKNPKATCSPGKAPSMAPYASSPNPKPKSGTSDQRLGKVSMILACLGSVLLTQFQLG